MREQRTGAAIKIRRAVRHLYAYPLYRNIDLSLRSYTLASFITGDAPFAGLSNYANVIESSTFAPALINTTIFVFASIAFQFAIGLALAVGVTAGAVKD